MSFIKTHKKQTIEELLKENKPDLLKVNQNLVEKYNQRLVYSQDKCDKVYIKHKEQFKNFILNAEDEKKLINYINFCFSLRKVREMEQEEKSSTKKRLKIKE